MTSTITDPVPSYLDHSVDVDSHEMVPYELYAEVFGAELFEHLRAANLGILTRQRLQPLSTPGIAGDLTEINYDTVWNMKGVTAPSAIDVSRRPQVLDEMGISRQLLFPTLGLLGLSLIYDPTSHLHLGFDPSQVPDPASLGREIITAHNDWAVRSTAQTQGRVRPAGILLTDSVESMVSQAQDLIGKGVRALMVPANQPPANSSPADPLLDPFWELAAETDTPVVLHLGTDAGFLASARWSSGVEVFHPSDKSTIELPIEPYRASSAHFCAENYLSTLVLGGVFERHPRLRFGAIELSAGWVGPLAERLDLWAESQFRSRLKGFLSMRPSEYIARNARVTPFYFEPVGRYLERHPNLSDVYCFSTDFPHMEGGKDSKQVFLASLDGASEEIKRKFFELNGSLLLPE